MEVKDMLHNSIVNVTHCTSVLIIVSYIRLDDLSCNSNYHYLFLSPTYNYSDLSILLLYYFIRIRCEKNP